MSGQTDYERRMARQRQLDMMEASASGVLPSMELNISSWGANDTAEGVFSSIRQRNQETARRFLYDEDDDSNSRRASVNTQHAQLFGARDNANSNLQPVNLMDHETGVYADPGSQDYRSSSLVSSIFGSKTEMPVEHDAVAAAGEMDDVYNSEVYIGDGSKPAGRATRTSGLCYNLRKNNPQGRRLRYMLLGMLLFAVVLMILVGTKKEKEYSSAAKHEANSVRYQEIRQAVILQGISKEEMFDDETSAEHDALRWIAYSDAARLPTDDPNLVQRYALAVFYYSSYKDFVRDHGEQKPIEIGDKQYEGVPVAGWHRRDYWLTEKGYCTWYGVSCKPRNINGEVTGRYDDNDQIIGFDMSFNHLYGQLPREFKGLSSLKTVNFAGNDLKGTFPPELGRMFMLTSMDLSDNKMTGTLPKEIGFLEGMKDFKLNQNLFSGKVPAEIERMYNLEHVNMDSNDFSGEFPSIENLANLETLVLSNNKFSKNIPQSFTHLTNLRELHLEYNEFSGTIPHAFKQLTKMNVFWLQQNKLSGTIPPGLFESNKDLERVDFEFNSLVGDLPATIGQLENLITLKLNNNQLSGSIPEEWTNLKSLKELYIENNKLKGSLPDSLSTMPLLRELLLDHNQITGEIPVSFGSAKSLEIVYLDHNKLSGKVPPEVSNLENLSTIRLESNSLIGVMPDEVCQMKDQSVLSYISADCDEVECACCNNECVG